MDITDSTDSSDASGDTGALRTEGGASIAKKLYVGTDLDVDGTAEVDNLTVGGAQGSDGQVLTSTGSGVAWEDAGGGEFVLISSTAISNAATCEFDYDDLNPSTYSSYMVTCHNVVPVTDNAHFYMFASSTTSGTMSWSTGIYYHGSTNENEVNLISSGVGNATSENGASGQIMIYNRYIQDPIEMSEFVCTNSSGEVIIKRDAREIRLNGDIRGIQFKFHTGNISAGIIKLYGIKRVGDNYNN